MFSVAIELGGPLALKHHHALAVSPSLRGYAEESQLRLATSGAAPKKLASITALAIRRCPTGRDLYLERVRKIHVASWERNVIGKVVDKVLVELHAIGMEVLDDAFERSPYLGEVDTDTARGVLYERGYTAATEILGNWKFPKIKSPYKEMDLEAFANAMQPGNGQALIDGTLRALKELVAYEIETLFSYVDRCRGNAVTRTIKGYATTALRCTEAVRNYSEAGSIRLSWQKTQRPGLPSALWIADVRATLNRLQTGIRLDSPKELPGATFGLSEGIRPDFLYAVTLIGDLKAGSDPQFYDTVATGYAIFAEYAMRRRINTAAILALDLDVDAGSLRSHSIRIVHPDDDRRMHWVTQRDLALRIFDMPSEPAHPDDLTQCGECWFREKCWVSGQVGGVPILDGKPLAAA